MNPQTFIFCAAIIAAFLIYRYRQRQRRDYFDALELSEAVQELADVMEQLDNADRMATDLEACRPGLLHRFFRASWMSSDGKNRTIDLCATGRGRATRGLAEAARAERDRLNQEAIDRIRALACALDAGDASQATVFEALPDDLSEDETAGQSGTYSGQNDEPRRIRGSA